MSKARKNKAPSGLAFGKGPAFKAGYNLHHAISKIKDEFPPSPIAEIYQNPSLTAGSRGIFPLSEPVDQLAYESQKKFKLNPYELISIDKIALIFGCPKESLESFWKHFKKIIEFGNPEIMPSNGYYRHCVRWMDDYIIQWGLVKGKLNNIRVELNPNKASLNPFAALMSPFKSHVLRFARISRLDVAVDYAMYLNVLCWHCANIRDESDCKNSGKINTRYFGSQKSDLQIRVYNKAAELLTKSKIDLGFDMWRVEAEIKAIKGEDMYLTHDEDITKYNPFENLSFYNQYGLVKAEKGGYALFVACARAYGVGYAASMLDKKTRRKYLDQLKNDMRSLPFNTPSEIYKNCFPEIYIRFVNRLHELFEKGQSLRLNK